MATESTTAHIERIIVRDTTVCLRPDSAAVLALLECDSLRRVQLRKLEEASGTRIRPQVMIDPTPTGATLLRVDCNEDSLQWVISLLEREVYDLQRNSETLTVEVEKPLSRWQRFISACGYCFLSSIVLTLAVLAMRIVARRRGL